MSISPWIRTPFTDFTGSIISHQWEGRCAKFEMRAIDCLEAYGLDKGLRKCEDLIADFQECSLRAKEHGRYYAMRDERQRQYESGERSKKDRFAESPKLDSY